MKYDVSKDETIEVVTGKFPAKIDVAVLLIFFNRPEKIQEVFEQVKKARPTKLYLYQDGARDGRNDDLANVAACREAVSDIDWDCEVHRLYQPKNYGCDPSEYIAQKWMFSHEEMGIVLEDDDVPSQSFFPYAKELLERYKDDTRIAIICGMNNFDVEKSVNTSYFFSKQGSIWGWASWKRFIDTWDEKYTWIDDPEKCEIMRKNYNFGYDFDQFLKIAKKHRDSGRAHYESINAAAGILNNMYTIVPKYNMIKNIGVGAETTHSTDNINLMPRRVRKLLCKKTYEIEFPLTHPEKVERCVKYDNKYIIKPWQRFFERFEIMLIWIIYKKPNVLFRDIKRKLSK